MSVDDEVVRKILTEELKNAIQELPETQKRRLEKYILEYDFLKKLHKKKTVRKWQ